VFSAKDAEVVKSAIFGSKSEVRLGVGHVRFDTSSRRLTRFIEECESVILRLTVEMTDTPA